MQQFVKGVDPSYFAQRPPDHQRLIWRCLTRDGKIALVKALITRKRP